MSDVGQPGAEQPEQKEVEVRSSASKTSSSHTEEEGDPESYSSTRSSSDDEQANFLLKGFFNAIRHNDPSTIEGLLAALRHDGTPQDIAAHFKQNLESLQDQGIMSEKSLDENEITALATRVAFTRPPTDFDEESAPGVSRYLLSSIYQMSSPPDSIEKSYAPQSAARCEEHAGIDEYIPCPRCAAFYSAINTFAAPPPEDELRGQLSPYSLEEENIMIIGVTQGWDKAKETPGFDHGWDKQALLDNMIKPNVRPIERLATYVARQWWKYESTPPDKRDLNVLPKLLHPTSSQLAIEHDEVINLSPWPSLREKLIRNQHIYQRDNFWQTYVTEFRFLWPYSLEDAFARSTSTGLVGFAPSFRKALADPKCWTLTNLFFDMFPEMHGTAPKYEPQLAMYRTRAMLLGAGTPRPIHARSPQANSTRSHALSHLQNTRGRKRTRSQRTTSTASDSGDPKTPNRAPTSFPEPSDTPQLPTRVATNTISEPPMEFWNFDAGRR